MHNALFFMVLGYVLIVVLLGMLSALVGFLWSLAERSDERLPRFFQARYDVLRETVVRGPLGNSLTEGEDGKEGGEGEDEDSASGGAASEVDDACLVLARRKRQATPARWSKRGRRKPRRACARHSMAACRRRRRVET